LARSSSDAGAPSILDTLLDYLPGGSDETKLRILGASVLLLIAFLGAVVVLVRRSHTELEAWDDEDSEADAVEVMVNIEVDEGPLLSVEDEDEEVLTVSESFATVVLEEESPSLSDELERKMEGGEGNARLERRMKRKQQREFETMAQSLQHSGLPPLAGLPPLPEGSPAPIPLPLPTPAPLPLPDLKRQAQCPSCQATFAIKDLMLKRTSCPVCQTAFEL